MALDTSGMLSDNIILVDVAYIEKVATDLSSNFSRMLGRTLPKADLAHWLDCIALDGGILPGDNNIQVIFIHSKRTKSLSQFTPSLIEDINGKAFKDNLGEFAMEAYPVASDVTNTADFLIDTMQVIIDSNKVQRLMVVADGESYGDMLIDALKKNKKQTTIFSMISLEATGFTHQILGYSIMSALGIRGEEL